MSHLPLLTPEQRAEALKKAAEARALRADVKKKLKNGELTLVQLLEDAKNNKTLAKLRVFDVLKSLPKTGVARATAVLEELKIDSKRKLSGLGVHQTEKLIQKYS